MSTAMHPAALPAVASTSASFAARVWRAWRGLTWRHVLAALGVGLALAVSNNIGLWGRFSWTKEIGPVLDLYFSFGLSTFLLLFAVVAADEFAVEPAWRAAPFVVAVTVTILASYVICQLTEPVLGFHDYVWIAARRGMHHTDIIAPLYFLTNQGLQVGFVAFIYLHHRDASRRMVALRSATLERAKLDRLTIESRLQVMQAHVEPAFLFNTLAQVERLYDTDPVNADRMLDDLIVYLRAALPHLRETNSNVGNEVRLVRSYLDILKLRLANGFDYAIDVAPDADARKLAPMLMLPLVDHVIARGDDANPWRSLGIVVATHDDALHLVVSGSGERRQAQGAPDLALDTSPDPAPALDPIRARLASLYGAAASLASRLTTEARTTTLAVTITIADETAGR
jgi:hypothetical protein